MPNQPTAATRVQSKAQARCPPLKLHVSPCLEWTSNSGHRLQARRHPRTRRTSVGENAATLGTGVGDDAGRSWWTRRSRESLSGGWPAYNRPGNRRGVLGLHHLQLVTDPPGVCCVRLCQRGCAGLRQGIDHSLFHRASRSTSSTP